MPVHLQRKASMEIFNQQSQIVTKLIVLIIFALRLCSSASARPHGFDDEGEMSVPRSPKIQGPPIVNVMYPRGAKIENFVCNLEGSPTPTVIWLKDGKEIQGDIDPYTASYNVQESRMELEFTEDAYLDEKYLTGNFTCMAANFLGRVQKTFRVSLIQPTTEEATRTNQSIVEDDFTVTNEIISGTSRRPRSENIASGSTQVDDDIRSAYHSESTTKSNLLSSTLTSISPNLKT